MTILTVTTALHLSKNDKNRRGGNIKSRVTKQISMKDNNNNSNNNNNNIKNIKKFKKNKKTITRKYMMHGNTNINNKCMCICCVQSPTQQPKELPLRQKRYRKCTSSSSTRTRSSSSSAKKVTITTAQASKATITDFSQSEETISIKWRHCTLKDLNAGSSNFEYNKNNTFPKDGSAIVKDKNFLSNNNYCNISITNCNNNNNTNCLLTSLKANTAQLHDWGIIHRAKTWKNKLLHLCKCISSSSSSSSRNTKMDATLSLHKLPVHLVRLICLLTIATKTSATLTPSSSSTTLLITKQLETPAAPVLGAVIASSTPLLYQTDTTVKSMSLMTATYNNNNNNNNNNPRKCSLSEFSCSNGRCVPFSKYCNNLNDCGDGSDEPRFCTRCNRTYYGDVGLTYSLELHRPKQDRLPYVCVLTFTAAGGQHGDLVQITLDSFTIGRFTSYLHDGCPDGYMQIAESARTPIGGMWCGTSWGPVLFYSESRSLIFTIKLNKLARDQSGYNFDFRMRYKVLTRESSVNRYGGIKLEELIQWHNRSSFSHINTIEDFINASEAHSDRFGQEFSLFSAYVNNQTFVNSLNKRVQKDDKNFTEPKYYLGDLIPGTYCSRIYSDCDRKVCRLQSPNYPGIYPRNLTCYYAVRQHEVPHGKHALILVKQPKGNLVWISTQDMTSTKTAPLIITEKDKKFEPRLKTWKDCDHIQDYVTIYDGYTTRDPIILKFCGGGQAVPAAVSSGPELLVEFTTSPYGTFTGSSSQLLLLYGFQLEVEVIFVDIQSPTYTKNKKPCEFWIRGAGRGILENPKHSLAPNTTCLYHLQGIGVFKTFDHLSLSRRTNAQGMMHQPQSRFKVWISLTKFNLDPEFGQMDETSVGAIGVLQTQEDCSGMLRIWDGALREPPLCKDLNCVSDTPQVHPSLVQYAHNVTNVIARFCRGTIPRTCDRSNINDTYARPCTISESYVSSTDSITLELKNSESTVLRPVEFKLKYEFVDLHQDGLPLGGGEHDCNRKFISSMMDRKDPAIFRSVRNVFLFGRGGSRNLKCVYKFEGMRGERVRLKLRKVTTNNRQCMSRVDEDINRSFCYGDTSAKVEIFERPYHDSILLPRGCLCNSSNSSHLPVEYTSTSRDVEVHFIAYNMSTLDDPDAINFEGMFEFIKGPTNCKDGRRKFGPSGTIDMTFGDLECRTRPWIIEPSNVNKFLYIRLKAIFLRKYNPKKTMNTTVVGTSSYRCETKSRAVLTTAEGLTITACPLASNSKVYEFVEIFSTGWNERPNFSLVNRSKAISVEYLRPENGDFSFNWMELISRPTLGLTEDCQYKCTELHACVNVSVWCDGVVHCPSGDDETFLQCSAIMKLPTEILATLCLIIILLGCAFAAFAYKKIKRKLRGSSVLQTRLKSLSSMDTAVLDEKEVIC